MKRFEKVNDEQIEAFLQLVIIISQFNLRYIPDTVLEAIDEGKIRSSLEFDVMVKRCKAAVVFADASGFTALTERLATRADGPEALSRCINGFFEKLLSVVKAYGGDVIKFSGDALTIIWRADAEPLDFEDGGVNHSHMPSSRSQTPTKHINNDNSKQLKSTHNSNLNTPRIQNSIVISPHHNGRLMREAVHLALQCCLDIHEAIETFETHEEGVQLTLHIGVGCGQVSVLQVGGVLDRWEYVVSGPPLLQISIAEPLAHSGETVASPEAVAVVQDILMTGLEIESHPTFKRVIGLKQRLPLPSPKPRVMVTKDKIPMVKRFIPPAVFRRLLEGNRAHIEEMRTVSVIFLCVKGLDVSTPSGAVVAHSVMTNVQKAVYAQEGSINKFLVDDKGVLLLAVFGLPPLQHSDDAARAVMCGMRMRQVIKSISDEHRMSLNALVGVGTGRVWCGVVGSDFRKEYTVLGDAVNLSARLMANSSRYKQGPGELAIDFNTAQACRSRVELQSMEPIRVKGKKQKVPVYCPTQKLFQKLGGRKHLHLELVQWPLWRPRRELERILMGLKPSGPIPTQQQQQMIMKKSRKTLKSNNATSSNSHPLLVVGGVISINSQIPEGASVVGYVASQIAADMEFSVVQGCNKGDYEHDIVENWYESLPLVSWKQILHGLVELIRLEDIRVWGYKRPTNVVLRELLDDAILQRIDKHRESLMLVMPFLTFLQTSSGVKRSTNGQTSNTLAAQQVRRMQQQGELKGRLDSFQGQSANDAKKRSFLANEVLLNRGSGLSVNSYSKGLRNTNTSFNGGGGAKMKLIPSVQALVAKPAHHLTCLAVQSGLEFGGKFEDGTAYYFDAAGNVFDPNMLYLGKYEELNRDNADVDIKELNSISVDDNEPVALAQMDEDAEKGKLSSEVMDLLVELIDRFTSRTPTFMQLHVRSGTNVFTYMDTDSWALAEKVAALAQSRRRALEEVRFAAVMADDPTRLANAPKPLVFSLACPHDSGPHQAAIQALAKKSKSIVHVDCLGRNEVANFLAHSFRVPPQSLPANLVDFTFKLTAGDPRSVESHIRSFKRKGFVTCQDEQIKVVKGKTLEGAPIPQEEVAGAQSKLDRLEPDQQLLVKCAAVQDDDLLYLDVLQETYLHNSSTSVESICEELVKLGVLSRLVQNQVDVFYSFRSFVLKRVAIMSVPVEFRNAVLQRRQRYESHVRCGIKMKRSETLQQQMNLISFIQQQVFTAQGTNTTVEDAVFPPENSEAQALSRLQLLETQIPGLSDDQMDWKLNYIQYLKKILNQNSVVTSYDGKVAGSFFNTPIENLSAYNSVNKNNENLGISNSNNLQEQQFLNEILNPISTGNNSLLQEQQQHPDQQSITVSPPILPSPSLTLGGISGPRLSLVPPASALPSASHSVSTGGDVFISSNSLPSSPHDVTNHHHHRLMRTSMGGGGGSALKGVHSVPNEIGASADENVLVMSITVDDKLSTRTPLPVLQVQQLSEIDPNGAGGFLVHDGSPQYEEEDDDDAEESNKESHQKSSMSRQSLKDQTGTGNADSSSSMLFMSPLYAARRDSNLQMLPNILTTMIDIPTPDNDVIAKARELAASQGLQMFTDADSLNRAQIEASERISYSYTSLVHGLNPMVSALPDQAAQTISMLANRHSKSSTGIANHQLSKSTSSFIPNNNNNTIVDVVSTSKGLRASVVVAAGADSSSVFLVRNKINESSQQHYNNPSKYGSVTPSRSRSGSLVVSPHLPLHSSNSINNNNNSNNNNINLFEEETQNGPYESILLMVQSDEDEDNSYENDFNNIHGKPGSPLDGSSDAITLKDMTEYDFLSKRSSFLHNNLSYMPESSTSSEEETTNHLYANRTTKPTSKMNNAVRGRAQVEISGGLQTTTYQYNNNFKNKKGHSSTGSYCGSERWQQLLFETMSDSICDSNSTSVVNINSSGNVSHVGGNTAYKKIGKQHPRNNNKNNSSKSNPFIDLYNGWGNEDDDDEEDQEGNINKELINSNIQNHYSHNSEVKDYHPLMNHNTNSYNFSSNHIASSSQQNNSELSQSNSQLNKDKHVLLDQSASSTVPVVSSPNKLLYESNKNQFASNKGNFSTHSAYRHRIINTMSHVNSLDDTNNQVVTQEQIKLSSSQMASKHANLGWNKGKI